MDSPETGKHGRYKTMNSIRNEVLLKPGERVDDLQRDGYGIIQDPKRFCFGMDAVLLAAFASVRPGERALDLGTGTGVIPILLKARTDGNAFTGLELSETSADMAARSVTMNGLDDCVSIVKGDLCEIRQHFAPNSFQVVTSNPPYMTGGHGLVNPDTEKAAARHEIWCSFDDVAAAAAYVLPEKGRFYLVHRPFRLAELICTLRAHRLEPKRMRLVYPFADREPNMVLLEAAKGGRPRMQVEKPLIIYETQGQYTEEVAALYNMQKSHEQSKT